MKFNIGQLVFKGEGGGLIKADLHIHTDISEGSLTTEEAIKIEKGLKEAIELGKNIRK